MPNSELHLNYKNKKINYKQIFCIYIGEKPKHIKIGLMENEKDPKIECFALLLLQFIDK